MENTILIESVKWVCQADTDQIRQLAQDLLDQDRRELILVPYPDLSKSHLILGIALAKYATAELTGASCVRSCVTEGEFLCFHFSRAGLPSYIRYISRRFYQPISISSMDLGDSSSDPFLSEEEKVVKPLPNFYEESDPYLDFLKSKTPARIEQELNERIIGQSELTKAVADFLYYHALRQQHPSLPQRPLLIAGPSGSGKTEVWRAAKQLYGNTFLIRIIDGSNISGEGWSGNYKIDTYLDEQITNGGILVVDEFDKLVTPKHSSSGDNVSLAMQAEFLKLVEGEYRVSKKKELTHMTSKTMGFVMVGAFEGLWERKAAQQARPKPSIGFRTDAEKPASQASASLTDEDFIGFGMMPELLGRIAVKCATKALDAAAYLDIIRGPHSRVALIEQVLKQYGIRFCDVLTDQEILALVATSRSNRTGVRWVSAQVETRLLEAIRQQGLFPSAPMSECA